ncbi:unnamed protein product [Brassica rapa subsp. trilocularis]
MFFCHVPRDGPRRPTHFAVQDWVASFRTASRADSPAVYRKKTNPQRFGTGRDGRAQIPSLLIIN